jgi:tetratricopeptide (TPR) repeat protein
VNEAAADIATEDELDDIFDSIVAAIQSEDRPLALRLAVNGLRRGLEDPLALVLAAEAATDDRDFERARRYLERAVALAPEEAETWRRLGQSLVAVGDLEAASSALGRALRLQPKSGEGLLAAANVDFQRGELSLAKSRFEAAAAELPLAAQPLEGLAAVAVRRRESAEARRLALEALQRQGATVGATMTLCRADLLDGKAEDAQTRVGEVLGRRDMPTEAKIAAVDLRAEARDALDDTRGAFADYTLRNRLIEQSTATAPWRAAERPSQMARRITRFLAASPAGRWSGGVGEDWEGALKTRAHVFLVGFPRSGTTLLEKTLASHPAVATLEEVDHLGAAGGDLPRDDASLARLMQMTPGEANRRRLIYWNGVRETLGAGFAGRVLVDKLPLHTLALPVIAKLFPTARVLFALRDPRDVVLSCFRRRFSMNAAMAEFLDLASAANFYDAVMDLAREARRVLPLSVLEVRMERMIADFDGEAARVLEFLGLRWDDSVRGFADLARERPRTPSDLQLLRGLDDAGVGQWRRYAGPLDPVLPILDKWVSAHDYSSNDQ